MQDGIDHINIYSKGKTELGQKLSNFYRCNVKTQDGVFQSVEGYWYWLSCKDDKLRYLSGWEAKQYGRECGGNDWTDAYWFRQRIKFAIKNKIMYNDFILKPFVQSSLPFKHYYSYDGKVVYPNGGEWVIDFITKLRNKLQSHVSTP